MQKRLLSVWNKIAFSLPVQLVVIQFKYHQLMLLVWVFFVAIVFRWIGVSLGISYLLLEPEYLGKENFWSVFLVGCALGIFFFSYAITLYISESYRYHFIALTESPFITFTYNNFIVPSFFFAGYFYSFINFHSSTQGEFNWIVAEKTLGLLLGIGSMFMLSAAYFFARLSFTYLLERAVSFSMPKEKQRKRIILFKARDSFRRTQRAQSYLIFPFQLEPVSGLRPLDFREIVKILSQHHERLLVVQILLIAMIAILGFLDHDPRFQIPAGASVLLVFSLMLMLTGAGSFWFRRMGILIVVLGLGSLYFYDKLDFLHHKHYAFGMDYRPAPAAYSIDQLRTLTHETAREADHKATLELLNNWKNNHPSDRPIAVFVSASGGGLRAAFWTFSVIQQLDSITSGRLSKDTRLMTGASGGMLGLGYFRELQWRCQEGSIDNLYDKKYGEGLSKDVLNRVLFKSFADMFLPNIKVQVGSKEYTAESGYAFDKQLSTNLPELSYRRLGDYAQPERLGLIPTLILTPTIINQGRKLFIASQPLSFLAAQDPISLSYEARAPGIEYRKFFSNHDPDSLHFITALRMNATFPYVTPIVELPSKPVMEIMDAGVIDNYGLQTAIKYLYEFRYWFTRNTGAVVFIQIRDNYRDDPIEDNANQGFLYRLMAPLGGSYYSMTEARDVVNDDLLRYVQQWYPGRVEIFSLEYPRETLDAPASMSWHLTEREKQSILKNLQTEENKLIYERIRSLYRP